MYKKLFQISSLLIALSLALAACATLPTPPTPTPQPPTPEPAIQEVVYLELGTSSATQELLPLYNYEKEPLESGVMYGVVNQSDNTLVWLEFRITSANVEFGVVPGEPAYFQIMKAELSVGTLAEALETDSTLTFPLNGDDKYDVTLDQGPFYDDTHSSVGIWVLVQQSVPYLYVEYPWHIQSIINEN